MKIIPKIRANVNTDDRVTVIFQIIETKINRSGHKICRAGETGAAGVKQIRSVFAHGTFDRIAFGTAPLSPDYSEIHRDIVEREIAD